jgi:hypothetical protein
MADPIFDKEGNLTNTEELTREEAVEALQVKKAEVFSRVTAEKEAKEKAEAALAKAEADLAEEKKKNLPPVVKTEPPASTISSDELRLVALGLSDAEINEAKDIAKGKGISLVEAVQTKTFKLFQTDLKEEERKAKAKLGASSGSDIDNPAPLVKSGMTKKDHQQVWKDALGKKSQA